MNALQAHTSTLPSCGPYSASLSPSNLPGACGWLLPFRQCPLISPGWREVTFMSYVYSRPPPPLLLPPSTFFAGAVGWNMQERRYCQTESVESPVHSPTDSTGVSEHWKDLKEWNPHKWSLNWVLQEEIVLILLEHHGHGSKRQKRRQKRYKMFKGVVHNKWEWIATHELSQILF